MQNTMEEVREYIRSSPPTSKIYVGCDSRQTGNNTLFVTVVVIHIEGNKGAKVFYFMERVPRISATRWRLIQETHYATSVALEIQDVVGNRELTVHLDYHPSDQHRSNSVVKEAVGYVLGQGLQYNLKPYAFAASCAADYLGRHGGFRRS
jgi:predicted RNase H-related nuclease YkuK (DUF458 family)